MKKAFIILLFGTLFSTHVGAQSFNLARLQDSSVNIFSLNLGLDHAFQAAIGIHHKFATPQHLIVGAEIALPSGDTPFDDWKLKLGGQYRIWEKGQFQLSAKAHFLLRKRRSNVDRNLGLGSDVGLIFGWYRPKYFIGTELSYDRNWVSNIRHGDEYLANVPSAVNGWYKSRADHLNLGLQGGWSWDNFDLNLRFGRTIRTMGRANIIPFYFLLAGNFRF